MLNNVKIEKNIYFYLHMSKKVYTFVIEIKRTVKQYSYENNLFN